MKNKMKLNNSNNPKKKCIYIKNIYISKNPKLNNSINSYFEPKKINSEINPNKNQPSAIIKQNTKKSVKNEYQNIYSQKQKSIIKSSNTHNYNYNYLSTKNIHIKSPKKEEIKDPNLFETYIDSISGRKSAKKKYENLNPLKERSNSENSLNYLTRTYTFFGKGKDNKNNNINGSVNNNTINSINNKKNNNENKLNNSVISSTTKSTTMNNELKINLNNVSVNKNIYNFKNNKNVKKNTNSRKYLYKESTKDNNMTKKNSSSTTTNVNNNHNKLNKDTKDILNNTELISYKNNNILSPTLSNSNINSISSSNEPNQENINNAQNIQNLQNSSINNKNSKRIQKYILSDKKRKTKSRQNFREYKHNKDYKENKSKSICPEPKKNSNNSRIENNTNLNTNINNIKYNYIKNKTNNTQIQMKNKIFNKEIENNIIYNGASSTNNNNYNDIGILFEQSALIIQSVFRGYLVKSRLETYLYNYKFYNQAVDILEKLFINYLKNRCNILSDKKMFLLKISKFPSKIKNIKSYKSCKAFKLINIPTSPLTESDKTLVPNKFIDLYLHKEIGERFNIIKTNNSKELEKKHKEELDNVNNKIIKLIKENNILKNINQKNKINETKYKELSLENKKKENIINIITSDNQNLAKKLKNLKDNKINQLEVQTPIKINLLQNNNKIFRNYYLLFLIKKKDIKYKNILRIYFSKYKNTIKTLNYEKKINYYIKEKYLNNLIIIIQKHFHSIIFQKFFYKLYYTYKFQKKLVENRITKKHEKLKHLLTKKIFKENFIDLKKNFNEFYIKGILSKNIQNNTQNKKNEILKNLKKIILAINQRNNLLNSLQYKNYFIKWTLVTRILSMKAVTDEKKRKKRQKQRTKRKIEKNKSEKKFLLSSSISQTINLDKNSINTNIFRANKKKEKEKDIANYLEHTVTTDFSLAETNNDIKIDKIIKGTEKLNDLFLKAAIFYKIFGNKNNVIDNKNNNLNLKDNNLSNKDNNSINNNNKDKKEIKVRLDNESDNDEDSGESSFGI